MANLPESLFGSEAPSSSSAGGVGASTSRTNTSSTLHGGDSSKLYLEQLIIALQDDHTREHALDLLYKSMGVREDLALLLWHSCGTVFTLLKEIIAVYNLISTPNLTERVSIRVCNALALLECVASHPDTRMLFIKAKIPAYLYPLLNNTNKEWPHERLRLNSLGVIGALVKAGDAEVFTFLIETQIFPCCLRCMEMGNELSKTVATNIIHKILMQDEGLKYCCTRAQRFYAVGHALANMVEKLAEEPSQRLLKLIIDCYLRLSHSPRACDGLKFCLPTKLRDATIVNLLRDDPRAMGSLQQLFHNVLIGHQSTKKPVAESLMHLIKG